jgi:hypothetical protein
MHFNVYNSPGNRAKLTIFFCLPCFLNLVLDSFYRKRTDNKTNTDVGCFKAMFNEIENQIEQVTGSSSR